MIRRFVPSLATELHLTIRLLHVHSEVLRSGTGTDRVLKSKSEQDRLEDPSSSRISISANSPSTIPTAETRLKEADDTPELKIVFRTGLDCRQFAANVLLGLKSLLPHIGADTLDLLAGSFILASQVRTSNRHDTCGNFCDSTIELSIGTPWIYVAPPYRSPHDIACNRCQTSLGI